MLATTGDLTFLKDRMQAPYVHTALYLMPIKHAQDFSILGLFDQHFQMSHHSIHSAVLPFHVRRRSLIDFEIESSK